MFCEDCIFWSFAYERLGDKFGICNEPTVNSKVKKESTTDTESEALFTMKSFGCIYFRKRYLAAASLEFLDPLIKK